MAYACATLKDLKFLELHVSEQTIQYRSPLAPKQLQTLPARLQKEGHRLLAALRKFASDKGPYFSFEYAQCHFRVAKAIQSRGLNEELDIYFVLRPTDLILPDTETLRFSKTDLARLTEPPGENCILLTLSKSRPVSQTVAAIMFSSLIRKENSLGVILGDDCPFKLTGPSGQHGHIHKLSLSENNLENALNQSKAIGASNLIIFANNIPSDLTALSAAAIEGATIILPGAAPSLEAGRALFQTRLGELHSHVFGQAFFIRSKLDQLLVENAPLSQKAIQ